MEKKIKSKSIEEVLDKLSETETLDSGDALQSDLGAEGLVFEYKKEEKKDKRELTAMAKEKATSEAVQKVAENEKIMSDPVPQEPVTSAENVQTRIRTTYVPRFTDFSDLYRLKGDPRLLSRLSDKKIVAEPRQEEEEVEDVPFDSVDPTSEIYDLSWGGAQTVSAPEHPTEKVESINYFKFNSVPDFVEEINGRTSQDEEREIKELLEPIPVATPEPVEQASAEPEVLVEEEIVEEKKAEPEKAHTIPDPDESEISVYEYTKSTPAQRETPVTAEPKAAPTVNKPGRIKETEYTNPTQRDGFKDRFLDSLLSIKIRLGAVLLFAASLFVMELLSVCNVLHNNFFEGSTVMSTLGIFDYLLAVCTFVLALPETAKSVRYLLSGRFMPGMFAFIGFIVLSGYTVAVYLTEAVSYPLFGFLYSLLVIASVSASLYRTKADFLAFKVISQNEEKQILDKRLTRELPAENIALDGIVDEYNSNIVRTFRTSFVSDFFSNSADVSAVSTSAPTVLGATFGIGLVSGVVAYFLAGGLMAAISVFTLSVLLGTPVFSLLISKLSFYQSQRAAVLEESAAVGEGAFYDFSSADVVAFNDTDIFGPEDVNLKRFMLYGERDSMEKAMRQMCALFSVVGGPLEFMFANAIDNRARKAATDTVIEDDGLSGDVSGHRICAGTEEYMRRNGIAIPDGASNSAGVGIDTTKVMYAAEDGEIYAKFYIRYSFSEEFTMLLPELKAQGVIPLVYTRDPNISNELLNTLTAGADCMRVVRMYTPLAEEIVYSRVSANMVTYGDTLNAISMVLLSKKYRLFSEKMRFIELCAMGVGLMLTVCFGIVGINSAVTLVSSIWHLVWWAALHYMSSNVFLKDAVKKKDEDQEDQ